MRKSLCEYVLALIFVAALASTGCAKGQEIPVIEVTTPGSGEEVTFQNGDVTLAGTLDMPAGEGPFPAIVTLHGSPPLTRNDIYNLRISHFFVQHGFAVLRYDKRGAGESAGEYPGVAVESGEESLNLLADDAIAGVEYLENHPLIDTGTIGLAGHSQGGWIGPLAASKSTDVAFVLAFSGPACTVGQEIYYSDMVEGGKSEETEISLQEASDMARDYQGPHGFDPMPALKKMEQPGLWLLGAKDNSIPVPLTVEILDAMVTDYGKPFQYIVYTNMNHGWEDEDTGGLYPVLGDALDWLNREVSN